MSGLVFCCMSALGSVGAPADVTWQTGEPGQVAHSSNLLAITAEHGLFAGFTRWDPTIYLRIPGGELDVSGLPFLTVRLYSSADADVLDVYYQCADGLWGLGRTLPVRRGWATYRADLREAAWTESGMAPQARQWGGVSKRITSFRLDPGNGADRWVVLDTVILSAEPTGPLGIAPEPRGLASQCALTAPREVIAGDPVRVEYSCSAQGPKGARKGIAAVWLCGRGAPLRLHLEPVDFARGLTRVAHDFPTSVWAAGGEFTVAAGVLELDSDRQVSALVTVTNPRTGSVLPPVTRVAAHRGEPALFVDGQPEPLIMSVHYGSPPGLKHAEMAGTRVKVFSDWFGASTSGELGHVRPGVYDYSVFDDYFAAVLDAVPHARFLPHLYVVAPRWWQELHPEECCLFSDGTRGPSSLASVLWKQEMAEDLRRCLAHLRSAPYADRILGYILCSGYTAEWQMWGTWQPVSDDYSDPALRAFREWLRRKYGTDEVLQTAWRDPDVTLATATIPPHERRYSQGPFLRDPATDRAVIDYDLFTSDMVAEAILYFARVAKEAVGESQIIGTYYGYMAAHGAQQLHCGHNALARVLDSPDVDFLMSPNMYAFRGAGETSTFMSATESVKLHGKLWIDEADLRTYLSDPGSGYGRTDTPQESVAVLWREFANVLTRHVAVSWFDMGGGWFSGQSLLDTFAQTTRIAQEAFGRRKPFWADVAVFVDERSFAYSRRSEVNRALVQDTIALMPRAGVTWDFYLLSDLANPNLPPYCLYVLLNAHRLDDPTQRVLVERAAASRATVCYLYAPGAATDKGLAPERIGEITGMKVALGPAGPGTYRMEPTWTTAVTWDAQSVLGTGHTLDPRPVIVDPEAEVIARYVEGGQVAVARKTSSGVPVVYVASAGIPPELLREIARAAGAHVYCETNDAFYTDGQFVALHASEAGEKTIRLPAARRVVNAITGELVAEQTEQVRLGMGRAETVLLAVGEP